LKQIQNTKSKIQKLFVCFWVIAVSFGFCASDFGFAADSLTPASTPEETLNFIESVVQSKTKDKTVIASMTALLDDPNAPVNVRERAAWAIGQLRLSSEVNKLVTAAHDKGLLVRSAALNALIRLRARSGYPVYLDIAQSDPILSLRQRAVLAIGLLRWDKAVNDLAKLSSDERAEVRAAAALAMAATQSKRNDFTQILKEMKQDADAFVQGRAQIALDIAQSKFASVQKYLQSEDADVRLYAAFFFHYAGRRADLAALKEAFNGEANDDVRDELDAAIQAINKRTKPAPAKKTAKAKASPAQK
jgi:HEAT repeat protein